MSALDDLILFRELMGDEHAIDYKTEVMHLRACVDEIAELRMILAQQAKYSRDMKRIFQSDGHSNEVYLIENLASYNYFKGAYESLRRAWWSVVHHT